MINVIFLFILFYNCSILAPGVPEVAFIRILASARVLPYLKAILPLTSPHRPVYEVFGLVAQRSIVNAFGVEPHAAGTPLPSLV